MSAKYYLFDFSAYAKTYINSTNPKLHVDRPEIEIDIRNNDNQVKFKFGDVNFKQFQKFYTSSGSFGRKIIALPRAVWSGVIKTIYHLAKAIFIGLPKYFSGNKNYFKAQIYSFVRDVQESMGYMISLFNDRLGLYHIQESQFQKNYYSSFIKKQDSNNESSKKEMRTVPFLNYTKSLMEKCQQVNYENSECESEIGGLIKNLDKYIEVGQKMEKTTSVHDSSISIRVKELEKARDEILVKLSTYKQPCVLINGKTTHAFIPIEKIKQLSPVVKDLFEDQFVENEGNTIITPNIQLLDGTIDYLKSPETWKRTFYSYTELSEMIVDAIYLQLDDLLMKILYNNPYSVIDIHPIRAKAVFNMDEEEFKFFSFCKCHFKDKPDIFRFIEHTTTKNVITRPNKQNSFNYFDIQLLVDLMKVKHEDLTELDLSKFNHGQITNDIVKQVVKAFPNLKKLSLCGSQIDGESIMHLKDLSNLKELSLIWYHKMTDEDLKSLDQLPQLKKLTLIALDKDIVKQVGKLFPNLKKLCLHGLQIDGESIMHLKELSSLKELTLDRCNKMTDEDLKSLDQLPQLKKLTLIALQKVTENGIKNLQRLNQLKSLSIEERKYSNETIKRFIQAGVFNFHL